MKNKSSMIVDSFKKLVSVFSDGEADSRPGGDGFDQVLNKPIDRRQAFKQMAAGAMVGGSLINSSCSPMESEDSSTIKQLEWEEYFKGNYRLMTDVERKGTVKRLEQLYEKQHGEHINVSDKEALDGVLWGYAFNISKCQGYMDCINGCIEENNQDRDSQMQYIRMHEMDNEKGLNFEFADDEYYHSVPAEGHFYIGTQCMHCENAPCVEVCPVEATWKEKDGIVVIDYDWCIGCRYCMAACPYDGRRFNWSKPSIPKEEVNKEQHYLGNRLRSKGVMEKCTFCVQRSRNGKSPGCVEACPTGSRVFGNILDPKSEIRYILENKKVFRLKEDLGTEPKFWYYMD
jgi:molybdopterin-containing oxidoreductase family iron-sulfur binding subunit